MNFYSPYNLLYWVIFPKGCYLHIDYNLFFDKYLPSIINPMKLYLPKSRFSYSIKASLLLFLCSLDYIPIYCIDQLLVSLLNTGYHIFLLLRFPSDCLLIFSLFLYTFGINLIDFPMVGISAIRDFYSFYQYLASGDSFCFFPTYKLLILREAPFFYFD